VDDILETWKKHYSEEKEVKNLISELIGAFNYRHWLALMPVHKASSSCKARSFSDIQFFRCVGPVAVIVRQCL